MPGAPSSVLAPFVAMPFAPSSFLFLRGFKDLKSFLLQVKRFPRKLLVTRSFQRHTSFFLLLVLPGATFVASERSPQPVRSAESAPAPDPSPPQRWGSIRQLATRWASGVGFEGENQHAGEVRFGEKNPCTSPRGWLRWRARGHHTCTFLCKRSVLSVLSICIMCISYSNMMRVLSLWRELAIVGCHSRPWPIRRRFRRTSVFISCAMFSK